MVFYVNQMARFCEAPELLRLPVVDGRRRESRKADVFSLGIVIYKLMFGGERPEVDADRNYDICVGSVSGLRNVMPKGFHVAIGLLEGMLANDPSKRPSAEVLLETCQQQWNAWVVKSILDGKANSNEESIAKSDGYQSS